jgi:prolyl-tRNA editing enzyme YbaK/EbsC (Cys-tRNA(Pro) deacylase)
MLNKLTTYPVLERKDLLAEPVLAALARWPKAGSIEKFEVAEINPAYSDTEAFCEYYGISADQTANTVIVEAVRAGERRLAVVVMLAASRADLNGVVRKALQARKLSLALKDVAVGRSGMEYGSITAIGLPDEWPLLVDARVLAVPRLVMGGGLRQSKLVFPGAALAELAHAQVVEDMAR